MSSTNVHVATHPLIAHKMSLLRNKKTQAHEFRKVLKEITFYLGFEVRIIPIPLTTF